MSRADSRVHPPGTLTSARGPAVRSALDAGPEAYHNPAAVWWGAFAASAVIREHAPAVYPGDGIVVVRGEVEAHGLPRRGGQGVVAAV